MRRSSTLSFLAFCLLLFSCALITPPVVVIPTPIPTAPPLSLPTRPAGTPVTDPVSEIVPNVDPDIQTLVNAVSQQQLTAYVQTLESFGTRNSFSDQERPDWGVGAARRWIHSEFVRVGQASNGRLLVEYQDFPLNYDGYSANQQNVIATLQGTGGNDRVIVIMAHYDTRPNNIADGQSRAPGANDNAAGIALLIETARLLSSRQWNQTIIFAAVAAEEQGTYGSKNLVQNLVLNGKTVLAALNYDTIGGNYGIPQYIRMFSPDLLTSNSGQLGRYVDYIAGLYVPTFPIEVIDAMDRETRWGDHREFIAAGMPAVRFTQSYEDPVYLNSTRDSWAEIDYSYHQKVVQFTVAVLANLAGAPLRPEPPLVVPMATPGMYLFTWAVDPQAAGYIISIRDLNSATYPTFRFVNNRDAGNVALSGIDPGTRYAVSLAPLTATGRVGQFSTEIIINQ